MLIFPDHRSWPFACVLLLNLSLVVSAWLTFAVVDVTCLPAALVTSAWVICAVL
jgi:hypothetical protein